MKKTVVNMNIGIGTVSILCALFIVTIPLAAMMVHWGFSYVAYGFSILPLASAFVAVSLSALLAALLYNTLGRRKLPTTAICVILLVAGIIGSLGEGYLYLNLAGCC